MLHTSTWYVLIFIDELILKLQKEHGKNGTVIPIPNSTEERFLVAIQSPIAHQVENQVVTHYICIKILLSWSSYGCNVSYISLERAWAGLTNYTWS